MEGLTGLIALSAVLGAVFAYMKRLNDLYEWGKIDADEFAMRSGEIEKERARPSERPAPLFMHQ